MGSCDTEDEATSLFFLGYIRTNLSYGRLWGQQEGGGSSHTYHNVSNDILDLFNASRCLDFSQFLH